MYKIFIVEDDEIIAGQLKIALEKWDYEVILSDNFYKIKQELAFDEWRTAVPWRIFLHCVYDVFHFDYVL